MAGTLRVIKIRFHAGPRPGASPLEIQPGSVVIFVGPNNSGKSLALREVEDWCFGIDARRKVVDAVEIDFPDKPDVAEGLLRRFETPPRASDSPLRNGFYVGQHRFRRDQPTGYFGVDLNELRQAVLAKNEAHLRAWLTSSYTVRLDGRTRFMLSDPQPTGDLQMHPQNHLWALFKDDAARERVRKLTEDAFDLHFVIDPTAMQQFRIRMSSRPPASKSEEQALDEAARRFHYEAPLITTLGDGVQAFVGLVSAVLSLPHKIILIDEPDAYLHPPLARRLGADLAGIAHERNASLVVATHSADFLTGCLEAVNDATIVRFTYAAGVATARQLSPSELTEMTRDPLLRSTELFRTLFHNGAVVGEADSDRAFYDEINQRLLDSNRGIRDALFLNAQNRQTIHRLIRPLRRIGIPVAAIVDLDLLQENTTNWERLLDACQVDKGQYDAIEKVRTYLSDILSTVQQAGQKLPIKMGGLNLLSTTDKTEAEKLLKYLSSYGLFLVPQGELETWLAKMEAKGHGSDWVVDIFSKMGQSGTGNYLRPEDDDVWKFIDDIASWSDNPERLGID